MDEPKPRKQVKVLIVTLERAVPLPVCFIDAMIHGGIESIKVLEEDMPLETTPDGQQFLKGS